MDNFNIILASNSPRRKELLGQVISNFIIKTKEVDEIYPSNLPVVEVAEYLAKLKASAFDETINTDDIIITADTIVVLGETIYGKPKDENDAIEILSQLSGKEHKVITGVCFKSKNTEYSFSHTTKVTFKKLSTEEITHYITKYKPYDKAGAYAIQEWIGFIGVKKIDGDYNNIVGLPVQELYSKLALFCNGL